MLALTRRSRATQEKLTPLRGSIPAAETMAAPDLLAADKIVFAV